MTDTVDVPQDRRESRLGADLAIVLTDPRLPDNPITYVNDGFQKMTLYSRQYAVGRNCRFLQGPETRAEDVSRLREGIAAGEEFETLILNYRADGTPFLNQLMIAPVRDDSGELVQFFGVQRHIAEGDEAVDLYEDGAQIETGVEMLRELQHRVKNHLSMIVGMIRLQARHEVSVRSFTALSRRIESLSLLYDELLAADATSGGNQTLAAGAYLSRIAQVVAGLEGRRSIRVNVDCDRLRLPVDTGARLGLLLSELLTNALEHAFDGREEGSVWVRLEAEEGAAVRLIVSDDGTGLPEDSEWPQGSATIAEQRRKLKSGAHRNEGGTSGVGGSIVLSLVRSLDADLTVEGGPDGTKITVTL